MFRRKKKADNTKGTPGTTTQDTNPKSSDDENRGPPKYFTKPKDQEIRLTEVLSGLHQRLKSLDKERTEVVEEIYQLGEEAEKEAEELEKELSILKKQTAEFEEVLSAIQAHKRVVRR